MKGGDKVVCVDAEGWLDPSEPGPSPEKDGVYVIRGARYFGTVLAYSLVGFSECSFYRACRFRPLASTLPVEAESAVFFGKDGEQ